MSDDRDSVVEVEFRIENSRYPLVSIPERAGCRTQIEEIVPRGDGTYAVFHCFEGADPERVVEMVENCGTLVARLVNGRDDGGLAEVVVTDPEKHFIVALTDAGAIPRDVRSANGVAHIVAEVPPMYRASDVVEQFLETHPSAEVVARRQKGHSVPVFTRREFQQAVEEQLTPRQREVLRLAYDAGYFDWPRRTPGEEVADELGISQATLSQHIRSAERKLLSLVFSECRQG